MNLNLKLIAIKRTLAENGDFANHPELAITLPMSINFFEGIGYNPPWIGYFVTRNDVLVGVASFKGKPVGNRIEIAYGTMPDFQNQGIGAAICRELVQLSLKTDPMVRICARTLREENYSVRLLRKNGFALLGTVVDEDDGEVWEWEFKK
jgi:[ribosomal protein S5]-alanine N-acetyltransferase